MKIGPYVSSCRPLNECFYVKVIKVKRPQGRGLKCISKERPLHKIEAAYGLHSRLRMVNAGC